MTSGTRCPPCSLANAAAKVVAGQQPQIDERPRTPRLTLDGQGHAQGNPAGRQFGDNQLHRQQNQHRAGADQYHPAQEQHLDQPGRQLRIIKGRAGLGIAPGSLPGLHPVGEPQVKRSTSVVRTRISSHRREMDNS